MPVLIDAHVHYHRCFSLERFLDAAWRNMALGAEQTGCARDVTGCLMLADTGADDPVKPIKDHAQELGGAGTEIDSAEGGSLICRRGGLPQLAIIPGRQLVTSEKVELLALGTGEKLASGRSMNATVAEIFQVGAIPVLPWGFGKWWFRRGRAARAFLDSLGTEYAGRIAETFVGDNAGRPQLSWTPPLFAFARSIGIRVLPGSDPLPFRSQVSRVGRYGSVLPGSLDLERPDQSVKALLRGVSAQPRTFGRRESLSRFCRFQAAMQMRKLSARIPR